MHFLKKRVLGVTVVCIRLDGVLFHTASTLTSRGSNNTDMEITKYLFQVLSAQIYFETMVVFLFLIQMVWDNSKFSKSGISFETVSLIAELYLPI